MEYSPTFSNWILVMTWLYLGLAFFEPHYFGDPTFAGKSVFCLVFELVILGFFLSDILFYSVHKATDYALSLKQRYYGNRKFLLRVILFLSFVVDFAIYYSTTTNPYRYTTLLRPVMILIYSTRIRHDLEGTVYIATLIFDLLFFFLLITLIFTIIVMKIMPVVSDNPNSDKYKSDFESFPISYCILWWGIFTEGYPDFIIPSVQDNRYTLIFFVPFILLAKFLWGSIPTATLRQGYVGVRGSKMFEERLIEREGLFACFYCLHTESEGSKIVTRDVFARFFRLMTNNDRDTDSVIHELFEILDENSRGYLVLEDFYDLPVIIRNHEEIAALFTYQRPYASRNKKSRKISATLRDIAESFWYSVFLFVISILNYIYIAILYFEYFETHDSGDRNELFVVVCEWGFLAIFLLDAAFRATAFGTQRFFLNNLNILDLALLFILFKLPITISIGRFIISSTTLYQIITKTPRYRSIQRRQTRRQTSKIYRLFGPILRLVQRIADLARTIYASFPMVLSMALLVALVTYVYAVLASIFFNESKMIEKESHYLHHPYSNFNGIANSMLLFLQIVVDQEWSDTVLDVYVRSPYSYYFVMGFFNSYYFISKVVIASIVEGLIWEFFLRIQENLGQLKEINKIKTQAALMRQTTRAKSIFKEAEPLFTNAEENNKILSPFVHHLIGGSSNAQNEEEEKKEETIESNERDKSMNERKHEEGSNQGVVPSMKDFSQELEFYQKKFEIYEEIGGVPLKESFHPEELIRDSFYIQDEEELEIQLLQQQDRQQNQAIHKRDEIEIGLVNRDTIMRQALLRQLNEETAKTLGNEYFDFKNQSEEEIANLKMQTSELNSKVMRIFRDNRADATTVIKTLALIENTLSESLLPSGSFARILFKDEQKEQWFRFLNPDDLSERVPARNGPWNCYESLFEEEEQIYKAENFFESKPDEFQLDLLIDTIFESFLGLTVDSALLFNEYHRKHAIWDLFVVPIPLLDDLSSSDSIKIKKMMLLVLHKTKNNHWHQYQPNHKNHNGRTETERIAKMMLLSEIQRKGLPIQDLVEELRDLQTLLTLFGQRKVI